MYRIVVSSTFRKQFRKLDTSTQKRLRKGLEELGRDPITSRSGADIRVIEGTSPQKSRLRVGQYRIMYTMEDRTIKVIEVFVRGREYRT